MSSAAQYTDPKAATLYADAGTLTVRSVITTGDPDRAGDVVVPTGLTNAEAYLIDNPVVLWAHSRTAVNTYEPTEGGTLVALPVLGELIDLQRELEAFTTAGASEIALPPNGRVQLPKLTGASVAYWVGEGSPVAESQPDTANLDLQAKKLGVLVKLTNELLRFASPSAEGLVRYDMARAARARRKKAGEASVQYIRFRDRFVLLATHGRHRFFDDEGEQVRDLRRVPLKVGGYSIGHRAGRVAVRIEREEYRQLKAYFLRLALRRSAAALADEFVAVPYVPYAPVRGQLLCVWRAVNRVRKVAGLEPVPRSSVPAERPILRPFGPRDP